MSLEQSLTKVRRHGDVIVIQITSQDIDRMELSEISQEIRQLIERTDAPKVVVNFKGVQWLPTLALGTFVALNKWIRQKAGRLRLASLDPRLRELFEITALDRVFQFDEDLDAALAGMRDA